MESHTTRMLDNTVHHFLYTLSFVCEKTTGIQVFF